MAIIEESHPLPQSGGVKRKLDQTSEDRDQIWAREIAECVGVLRARVSWKRSGREGVDERRRIPRFPADFVDLGILGNWGLIWVGFLADNLLKYIVDGDAVPALATHLKAPPCLVEEEDGDGLRSRPLEVEARSAFALGLLAANIIIGVFRSGYLLSRESDLSLGRKFD
ncbi:hypothetical protein Sjap_006599 [Stephania japonica]|uniref:Uncharacterized protein n=1 Tax=Stephania japonica TaxID=461633 RepID=A0AAP0PMY8_9MAGN